jgi:hypothetical protein
LVVLEETVKEGIAKEPKSLLEEGGEHYNLFGIGCWDVLPYGRPPLKYDTIQEKVMLD